MNDETWVALKWIFSFTPIWKTLVIILPLASVVVFAHGWTEWQRDRTVSWQFRALILAALVVLTITLVEVSAAIHYYFYVASTYAGRPSIWQGTEKPIADMMLARTATRLALGSAAAALCLALGLLLPKEKKN